MNHRALVFLELENELKLLKYFYFYFYYKKICRILLIIKYQTLRQKRLSALQSHLQLK